LCAASLDKLFFSDESAKKYRGPMPSQKAVLLQLATGLEYIHEKKVIHRDITPKNILIWVNPENSKQVLLKWADFGLSKQIGKSETYTVSKVRGAEGWLAPEILEILDNQQQTSRTEAKQRGTIKSDVFNQGLVFGYYLLKGRHLFGGLPEPNIYRDKPVNLDSKSLHIAEISILIIYFKFWGFPFNRMKSCYFLNRTFKYFYRNRMGNRSRTDQENDPSQPKKTNFFIGCHTRTEADEIWSTVIHLTYSTTPTKKSLHPTVVGAFI
jgi:serine/threonine protein kinase